MKTNFKDKLAGVFSKIPPYIFVWMGAAIRMLGALTQNPDDPYYRVSVPEVVWMGLLTYGALLFAKDHTKITKELHNGSLMDTGFPWALSAFLAPCFAGSLAVAVLRYGVNPMLLLNSVFEDVLVAVSSVVLGMLAIAIMKGYQSSFIVYIGLCIGYHCLGFGSDTLISMIVENILFCIAILLLSNFIERTRGKKKDQVFKEGGITLILSGCLVLFLISWRVLIPSGRTLSEWTGGRIEAAATTDLYGPDGASRSLYDQVYIRPVLPIETGAEGPACVFKDSSGRALVRTVEIIGGDTIHLRDYKSHITEILKRK